MRKESSEQEGSAYSPRQLEGELNRRFQFVSKLGEGSFGTVLAVLDRQKDTKVALKKVKVGRKESISQSSLREIVLLRWLSHPNIVRLIDVFHDSEEHRLAYTLEMHPRSLHDYIKAHSPLPTRRVQDFSRDLMRALAYLHRRRVMHRDVKPSNLLISDKGLQLCDFGQAKIKLPNSETHSPEISTLFYRAPEVLLGGKEYDEKVDMWAAGCVVAEMLLGEYLFKANSELGMLMAIFQMVGTPHVQDYPAVVGLPHFSATFPKFEQRQIELEGLSEAGNDFLRQLLVVNPKKRMSSEQALQHIFLTSGQIPDE